MRDLGPQPGSASRWAVQREPAVERFDTVGEAAQAGPLVVRAADPVIRDRYGEQVGVDHGAHDRAATT